MTPGFHTTLGVFCQLIDVLHGSLAGRAMAGCCCDDREGWRADLGAGMLELEIELAAERH